MGLELPRHCGLVAKIGMLLESVLDDRTLNRRLEKLQAEDDAHVWPADQFAPVAIEGELVFERLGLRQLSLPLAA